MHECKQETVIEIVLADLKEIKADVKTLLMHKARLAGMASLGLAVGTVFGYLIEMFLKK